MNLNKFKITDKGLYWGLIGTFMLLYVLVAFVSTLHAIDFFRLANVGGLAILLGVAYEIGQASVLFSILMSEKNKAKFLPWVLMVLLTALQMTANVYASFKHIVTSGSNDWIYWQKSILFSVQASSPEMYQMIISWISGALLPVVALGMTALVAQNITFIKEENEGNVKTLELPEDQKPSPKDESKKLENESNELDVDLIEKMKRESDETLRQQFLEAAVKGTRETYSEKNAPKAENNFKIITPSFQGHMLRDNITMENGYPVYKELEKRLSPEEQLSKDVKEIYEEYHTVSDETQGYGMPEDELDKEVERMTPIVVPEEFQVAAEELKREADEIVEKEKIKLGISKPELSKKTPQTLKRGWHLKKRYLDSNGDVYLNGIFSPEETALQFQEPKKA